MKPGTSRSWLGVAEAAAILGVDDINLRRACERNARRASDGVVESNFDGIRARKLGRLWRILLGPGWMDVPANDRDA